MLTHTRIRTSCTYHARSISLRFFRVGVVHWRVSSRTRGLASHLLCPGSMGTPISLWIWPSVQSQALHYIHHLPCEAPAETSSHDSGGSLAYDVYNTYTCMYTRSLPVIESRCITHISTSFISLRGRLLNSCLLAGARSMRDSCRFRLWFFIV